MKTSDKTLHPYFPTDELNIWRARTEDFAFSCEFRQVLFDVDNRVFFVQTRSCLKSEDRSQTDWMIESEIPIREHASQNEERKRQRTQLPSWSSSWVLLSTSIQEMKKLDRVRILQVGRGIRWHKKYLTGLLIFSRKKSDPNGERNRIAQVFRSIYETHCFSFMHTTHFACHTFRRACCHKCVSYFLTQGLVVCQVFFFLCVTKERHPCLSIMRSCLTQNLPQLPQDDQELFTAFLRTSLNKSDRLVVWPNGLHIQ